MVELKPDAWLYEYPNGLRYIAIEREPTTQRNQTTETPLYRRAPVEVSEAMVERVARSLCELHIRRERRHDTDPQILEQRIASSIDYAWKNFADDATAAIRAMTEAKERTALGDKPSD